MRAVIDRIDVLDRVRRPAYTGANRCLPCTAVNIAIAGVLATGLVLVTGLILGAAAWLVGAVAFGLFLAIIALRGYLIPGTPTLTRRYFPDRVLRAFGKTPERPTVEIEDADLETALTALGDAGVVRRGEEEHAEDVVLSPGFRERWDERLDAFASASDDGSDEDVSPDPDWRPPDSADVAAMVGGDGDVESRGAATFEFGGTKRLRWASDAALAADVAADRELRIRLDGWEDIELDDRRDVLTALRLRREYCPVPHCEGDLDVTAERLEHCCRRPQIGFDSTCEDCGRSLVALAVPEGSHVLDWVPEPAIRDVAD